jgi:SAM-dependent methyltransferase
VEDCHATAQHYDWGAGAEIRVETALRTAGSRDQVELSVDEIGALDQFHVGGVKATQELAQMLAPSLHMRVLDVGSGLGGPARYLAQKFGCHVTGIDITEAYCRLASVLSERLGLHGQVEFRHGNAVQLPFSDNSFDAVWTQHASMNISDKRKFYREIARVLKRGGRFAMYDVALLGEGPILFPVPWAREVGESHLATAAQMQTTILQSGFSRVDWNEITETALQSLQSAIADIQAAGPRRLGLHLLLGSEFLDMLRNFLANLEQRRCGVFRGVFVRAT